MDSCAFDIRRISEMKLNCHKATRAKTRNSRLFNISIEALKFGSSQDEYNRQKENLFHFRKEKL